MDTITADKLVEKLDSLPPGTLVVTRPFCQCGDPIAWCKVELEQVGAGVYAIKLGEYFCTECKQLNDSV